jgi:hypothetical protein
VVSGANRHDVKLLEETLPSISTAHPEGENGCFDAGVGRFAKACGRDGIYGHGERKKNTEFVIRR